MVELIKLEIEGIGKFDKKKTINFKKGVNFITGLNETGKSTILEAILASLFNYTNTTHQYVKEHFGFDEQKVFENTTFIRQSQMVILGDSTTKNKLRDMIEEVLVGSAEASATKALKKIKKVAKDSKTEAESLEESLNELQEDLQKAEEHKSALVKDSGEHDAVSKTLADKEKKFEELKKRKERFDEKEKYQKEFQGLDKEVKNIDKALLSINDSVKKREKLMKKLKN